MYAQVTTVRIPTDHFESDSAAAHAHALPLARDLPGFGGMYWLGERSAGLMRSIVFFDSADHLRLSGEQWAHNADAAARSVAGAMMSNEAYEVVADTGQLVSYAASYSRSLSWQEDPTQMAQAIRRIKEGVLPGVRRNAGFQGGFWLAERGTGRCMGVTLWDTAENLHTSGAVGRQMRDEPIRQGQLQALELREYEIVARADP